LGTGLGKSQEGQKFKSRISFWTLRPTEMRGRVIRPTESVGVGVGWWCVCWGVWVWVGGGVMMLGDAMTPF